jgi:hypothetical protein
MKNLAVGALFAGLLVACGGDDTTLVIFDSATIDTPMVCNPLTQAGCMTGEKCTWLVDAVTPSYVGHVGCAPDGTANAGEACMYGMPGASGYDNCKSGNVCGNYRGGAGTCKKVCDQQGGTPDCGNDVCVTYSKLFDTGPNSPAAAGVCDKSCDPLGDNDFDGSGTDSAKTGSTCPGGAAVGCYGYPSFGTPPKTGWSCTSDINSAQGQPLGLRHRVQCIDGNMCSDAGDIYVNSCNQGYLPLLIEQTGSTTAICVAMCKPKNCATGDCGPSNNSDQFRVGEPGSKHTCATPDRMGKPGDATTAGLQDEGSTSYTNREHCQFLWYWEIDDNGNFLNSGTSDSLGICFDHSSYKYDPDGSAGSGSAVNYPPCATLAPGFSMQNEAIKGGDVGCGDSTTVQFANGKAPADFMEKRRHMDLPRMLYHRQMNTKGTN